MPQRTNFQHEPLHEELIKYLDDKYRGQLIPTDEFIELIDGMELDQIIQIFNRYVKDPMLKMLSN